MYIVKGNWNTQLNFKSPNDEAFTKIISLKDKPEKSEQQYCFSFLQIKLNHINQDMLEYLPQTDVRFRPDIRAYENGDLELATSEKNRLEVS